jgi:hypothetical protein
MEQIDAINEAFDKFMSGWDNMPKHRYKAIFRQQYWMWKNNKPIGIKKKIEVLKSFEISIDNIPAAKIRGYKTIEDTVTHIFFHWLTYESKMDETLVVQYKKWIKNQQLPSIYYMNKIIKKAGFEHGFFIPS